MSLEDRFNEALQPIADVDSSGDFRLFTDTLSAMLQPAAGWAEDDGVRPGWAVLMDPDTTPDTALAWLAQFVGVRLRVGLSVADQRERVKSTDGFKRGTVGAMIGAAQQYLTGTKSVILRERHGSPYIISVVTLISETPDPGQVLQGLLEQKPAGLVLTHDLSNAEDYLLLRGSYDDYTEVGAAYVDYDHVRLNDPI